MESGARFWIAIPEVHLASWSMPDQQFINELAKKLAAEWRVACPLNTNPGAKPIPQIQNVTSSTSARFAASCSKGTFSRHFASLYSPPRIWCTNGGAYKHAIILPPS